MSEKKEEVLVGELLGRAKYFGQGWMDGEGWTKYMQIGMGVLVREESGSNGIAMVFVPNAEIVDLEGGLVIIGSGGPRRRELWDSDVHRLAEHRAKSGEVTGAPETTADD